MITVNTLQGIKAGETKNNRIVDCMQVSQRGPDEGMSTEEALACDDGG